MSGNWVIITRNSTYFLKDLRPGGDVYLTKLCNNEGKIDSFRLKGSHWNVVDGVLQVWKNNQSIIRTSDIQNMIRV